MTIELEFFVMLRANFKLSKSEKLLTFHKILPQLTKNILSGLTLDMFTTYFKKYNKTI